MFLFIFESIGTSELILIGIVALMFLGPRKLPEIARKMGKMINEFRSTTNEFKSTWEREVNFDEEARALRTGDLDPVSLNENTIRDSGRQPLAAPSIKSIDREAFDALAPQTTEESREPEGRVDENTEETTTTDETAERDELSDKRAWL